MGGGVVGGNSNLVAHGGSSIAAITAEGSTHVGLTNPEASEALQIVVGAFGAPTPFTVTHLDPLSAFEDDDGRWAASLAQEKERDIACEWVANSYAQRDPAAATKWLDSLPQGSYRDRATASFATALREKAPDVAADWAIAIASRVVRMPICDPSSPITRTCGMRMRSLTRGS